MAGCSSSGASNDYITISKYEGVEVEAVDVPEITDESVENNIQKVLEGFAVLNDVDRVIQDGDVVTIDYATYVNGSKVDSETASANGYQLTIGNNSLYDGFDGSLFQSCLYLVTGFNVLGALDNLSIVERDTVTALEK